MPLARSFGVGLGGDEDEVGVLAVGDEDLRAGEAVDVAVAGGAGADRLHVGAGGGLGHRQRADELAGHHLRQPAGLLLRGAVGEDVVGDDRGVDAEAPAREVGAGVLHEDHRVVAEVAAGAAVLLGDRGAEEADLAGLVPGLAVHHALGAPGVEAGRPAFGDEVAGELGEHAVLVGHPGRGERRDHQKASAGRDITGSAPDRMRARWSAVAGSWRAM